MVFLEQLVPERDVFSADHVPPQGAETAFQLIVWLRDLCYVSSRLLCPPASAPKTAKIQAVCKSITRKVGS